MWIGSAFEKVGIESNNLHLGLIAANTAVAAAVVAVSTPAAVRRRTAAVETSVDTVASVETGLFAAAEIGSSAAVVEGRIVVGSCS